MKNSSLLWIASAAIFANACNESKPETMNPNDNAPKAKKIPHEMTIHGDTRVDNYYWMKLTDQQKDAAEPDGQTKDVLDYLNAENTYREQIMAGTKDLQENLFNEIVGRIKQTDMSVPVKDNGYMYYVRYEEGKEYPYYCRKKDNMAGAEEVMLDGPKMAEGHTYFSIGGTSVSEDNKLLVYGTDFVSRRQYTLQFKNLETGEIYPDKIENTTGGATWAADNKTVFYTRKDPVDLRSFQIYKHVMGTDPSSDVLIFEEEDKTFSCYVYKTKSDKYIVIGSGATLSNEYRVIEANKPNDSFRIIQPRERNLEYSFDHYGDHFYIVTNLDAQNFRLMKTPVGKTTKENWVEVIPHRKDVLLEGIEIFKDYLIVQERIKGLTSIHVTRWDGKADYYMEFDDPTYTAYVDANPDFDTEIMRFGYTSMTTPNSTYDFNLGTKERTLLKQQEVMDPNFSIDNYTSERLFATAKDGTLIPISIVYKKGTERNGHNPTLLYAYGSYGASMDAYFSSVRLSLLDRGFVYAIAHIRGGQEMGRQWYEDGKLLKKINTFTDFIDCGEFLVKEGFTNAENLYAQGGSAGGLLMGAVTNMRPDLWKGVIAQVPFVDVVTTMLDEDIPLTTGEFDEWGNPKDAEYYKYMKSYSPYDNVVAKDYPNILVTTGYWDSQVQYWEPAKWVAKLRELKTDKNLLLMYCNMDTGHGGASGRFERYRETALEMAFIFMLAGIEK